MQIGFHSEYRCPRRKTDSGSGEYLFAALDRASIPGRRDPFGIKQLFGRKPRTAGNTPPQTSLLIAPVPSSECAESSHAMLLRRSFKRSDRNIVVQPLNQLVMRASCSAISSLGPSLQAQAVNHGHTIRNRLRAQLLQKANFPQDCSGIAVVLIVRGNSWFFVPPPR